MLGAAAFAIVQIVDTLCVLKLSAVLCIYFPQVRRGVNDHPCAAHETAKKKKSKCRTLRRSTIRENWLAPRLLLFRPEVYANMATEYVYQKQKKKIDPEKVLWTFALMLVLQGAR